jgi:hypothetical protein
VFEPRQVFENLYKGACSEAILSQNPKSSITELNNFLQLVEDNLADYVLKYISTKDLSVADIHRANIQTFRALWKGVYTDHTCLVCLRRIPDFILPCGHFLCETCIRIFGDERPEDYWIYHVPSCLLCGMDLKDLSFRVKPDTAGVVVLSIDGGGIRGKGPLQVLQLLQDRIPFPIQESVDVTYGASSGKFHQPQKIISDYFRLAHCPGYILQGLVR